MFEVKDVAAGSAANNHGIKKGDKIASINGQQLIDYIDYVYFSAQERLKIKLFRDDQLLTFRIKKDDDEDLGLDFIQPLMGAKRVCANKCIFCFVDQLPRGMRTSLYLKDEDWRYSLIMGNYVTMSSIDKSELKRIIKRRVSPLYISVHTVDEALRRRMLGNGNAVKIRPLLKKLKRSGISFHAQAVVCPGVNDEEKLEETISFLAGLHPACKSLAVVPVGLTEYRGKLEEIKAVTKQQAAKTVNMVERWQQECLNRTGTRFVFAADEYYIKAGLPLPGYESYEAFEQIENGVGMMTKFLHEAGQSRLEAKGHLSVATGVDAFGFFKEIADGALGRIDVYSVCNKTFGSSVTVSGLLAGRDYLEALRGKQLGGKLLISADSLKDGKVFLDDMSLDELESGLGVKIIPVTDGYHFAQVINED